MIKKIFANRESFNTVEFKPGFNIIWADRTMESTKRDSRNGLGKSTLIEIIHFCLGAKASRGKGLLVDPLRGWEFSMEIQIGDRDITITRAVDRPGAIIIEGDISQWPPYVRKQWGQISYSIKDWNSFLGYALFGLPMLNDERTYKPTFRSLISYFVRRGKDAFSTPFEHHRKQLEWDKQVNNAFLLGLSWEDAAELQVLKDRKKGLQNFKKAAKSGVIKEFIGSKGDLEAQKIRLKAQIAQEASQLQSFRVHPQYEQLENEANQLTEEIHEIVNAITMDKRLLDLYAKSIMEEQPPVDDYLPRLYAEAGVALPGVTLRRIDEVQKFHRTIIENRRTFLVAEIERLQHEIDRKDQINEEKTKKRASIMEVLHSHGALEEYITLQKRHMEKINRINAISTMIDNLKAFESGLSDVKIAQEELQKKARQDYDERSSLRERAITIFNNHSESLYRAPGKLVIDVGTTGFHFDVEIERSGSSGVNNMKVFCYDLTLAQLWAAQKPSPRFLIHDSTIFDGVDERQRARALESAAAESQQNSYQYICALNSDYVPWNEFSQDFDLKKHIIVTLTDQSVDGCLLGIRF